jgi:UDP-glucose 4-epimerase
MSLTAVVTGGCGFIGSHLTERLLAAGYRVAVIDNLSTGRLANLQHLTANPMLTVHTADIRDAVALPALFAGADYVFHLAALADIVPSIQRPEDYFTTNVDGTFNVVQAARAAGAKRFVYSASSSCYGIPDAYPTPETAPTRPQYPYALSKLLGEQIVLHWNLVYGVPSVSLRFFNVYGPRARTTGTYGAVFGVFLAQRMAGKPYTVVGDGTQTRDFTYVTDIAAALQRAAESDLAGEILNIGSGGTYSVNELVRLLGGDITYVPKRPGEPDCTFADVSKVRDLLGWSASVAFPDGVRTMLEHAEDWRDAPVWDPASIAEATRDWFRFLQKEPAVKP